MVEIGSAADGDADDAAICGPFEAAGQAGHGLVAGVAIGGRDAQIGDLLQAVEAGDGEAVDAAGCCDRVAYRERIEPTDPEFALPGIRAVVVIGQTAREIGVFGDEGTGSMAHAIGAQDAQAEGRAAEAGLGQQALGVGERRLRAGRIGEEGIVLVQQHALRAFEQHGAVVVQPIGEEGLVDQLHARREGRVGGDDGVDGGVGSRAGAVPAQRRRHGRRAG